MSVRLDVLAFVTDGVVRQCRDLGRDGRSIVITLRPLDGRYLLFLYVVSLFSLLTVSDFSVPGLFT